MCCRISATMKASGRGKRAAGTGRKVRGGDISRRDFLGTAARAATGAMLVLPRLKFRSAPRAAGKVSDMNIALVGAGSQGQNLMVACLKIPGIRFKAVCDIWPFNRDRVVGILNREYGHSATGYEDYRQMLSREKGLDAVLIATPDWVHSEQSVACLEAGKHVYCEKEMSHTVEGARKMVRAAARSGKLLQIGHQRRSNPRYLHGRKMVVEDRILGRLTHAYGQWNRARLVEATWPARYALSAEALKRHGYDTMERFRNWRWFRKFSGGPISDLGSHQVDIMQWFLRANPSAVTAVPGRDYQGKGDWYDNIMAIYEFKTPDGPATAFYQVLNMTSHRAYYEAFTGFDGSLEISEDPKVGFLFREASAQSLEWGDLATRIMSMGSEAIELKIGESRRTLGAKDPEALRLKAELQKPVHQAHLENFFEAVRGRGKLNCPADLAFESAVAVLKTNEAADAGRRMTFNPSEFRP
jgi:predicted dehydrogenase